MSDDEKPPVGRNKPPKEHQFGPGHPGTLEAGHQVVFDEMTGHIVRSVGVENDRVAGPFHCYGGVAGLACGVVLLTHQMHGPARQQEFTEPARVRKKGLYGAAPQPAADQEPVGPILERGDLSVSEDAKGPRGRPGYGSHSHPVRWCHQVSDISSRIYSMWEDRAVKRLSHLGYLIHIITGNMDNPKRQPLESG